MVFELSDRLFFYCDFPLLTLANVVVTMLITSLSYPVTLSYVKLSILGLLKPGYSDGKPTHSVPGLGQLTSRSVIPLVQPRLGGRQSCVGFGHLP